MALVRTILRKACNDWEWLDRAPKVGMFKNAEGRTRLVQHPFCNFPKQ